MSDILAQLHDFRQRVLEADRLTREGKIEEAEALRPSKSDLVEAIKAWRKAVSTSRAPAKAASAATKSKAAEIRGMSDLSQLF